MQKIEELLLLITSSTQKKFKSFSIREFEEEKPNQYVCFVDDVNESYDVQIVINNNEVTESQCDCSNGNKWCLHKLLVLQTIVNHKIEPIKKANTITVAAKKRKVKPYEALLENVTLTDLKNWITEYLEKNKEVELAFVNHFTPAADYFTPEIVTEKLNAIVNQILKKRKTVEAAELKKIIDLLDVACKPILSYIAKNITDKNAIECAASIIEFCILTEEKFFTTSNKLPTYLKKVNNTLTQFINEIEVKQRFEATIERFLKKAVQAKKEYAEIKLSYLQLILQVAETNTNYQPDALVIITKWFKGIKEVYKYNIEVIEKPILNFVVKMQAFSSHYHLFSIQRYQPEYNNLLLNQLIEIEQYEKATTEAKACISMNSNEKYNLAYYIILKTIAKKTNNTALFIE